MLLQSDYLLNRLNTVLSLLHITDRMKSAKSLGMEHMMLESASTELPKTRHILSLIDHIHKTNQEPLHEGL